MTYWIDDQFLPLGVGLGWEGQGTTQDLHAVKPLGEVPTVRLQAIPESCIVVHILWYDVRKVECLIHCSLLRDKHKYLSISEIIGWIQELYGPLTIN